MNGYKRLLMAIATIATLSLTACTSASIRPKIKNIATDVVLGTVLTDGRATHNELNMAVGQTVLPQITFDTNAGVNDNEVKACIIGDNDTLKYVAGIINFNDGAVLNTIREMMIGDENSTKVVLNTFRKMEAVKNADRIKTMPLDLGVVIPRPKFGKMSYNVAGPEQKEQDLIKYNLELIRALKKANKRLDNIRAWRRSVK